MQDDIGQRPVWGRAAAKRRRLVFWLFGMADADDRLASEPHEDLWRAEIEAQAEAIARQKPTRLLVIALIALIFVLYLPWYVVLPCVVIVVLADALEVIAWRRILRHRSRPEFGTAALIPVFLGELCFCLPAALIWHIEDPFSKAISIGVFSLAMMQLTTIRSIRPSTGLAGLAALAGLIAASNTTYWLRADNLVGLAITTMIAVVALGNVAVAIVQNHRQRSRAAISLRAALQATDAKSRFLAQLSHELRTPLNAIIGTGTAALVLTGDVAVKAHLVVLLKSAEGLALMLNDILDLSAVAEGHIQLRPRVADVVEEVGHTVALFRTEAESRGLAVRLKVHADVPQALRLDFDRFRQVLSNLLSNALKYAGQGQIEVRLRLDPPSVLVLEVQDSGPGVPPGDEERIFQEFVRASTEQSGHGLGLSICRKLLNRMGGQIRLLPSDLGARFEIRLPVERALLPAPPVPVVQDLAGVRVLVVDDIATNRLVAAIYLGLLDCSAREAATGPAALTMLEGVDVVLLDMNMPGMDGLQTLAMIRASVGLGARVPVVAMTADALDHDRARYLGAGLDGYVSKPLQLNALRSELARVLARQGRGLPPP